MMAKDVPQPGHLAGGDSGSDPPRPSTSVFRLWLESCGRPQRCGSTSDGRKPATLMGVRIMGQNDAKAFKEELSSLREELGELRRQVGEIEHRLTRLEVREELLESPEAAGDSAVDLNG